MVGAIRQELLAGVRVAEHFKRLSDALRAFPDVSLDEEDYAVSPTSRASSISSCTSRDKTRPTYRRLPPFAPFLPPPPACFPPSLRCVLMRAVERARALLFAFAPPCLLALALRPFAGLGLRGSAAEPLLAPRSSRLPVAWP
jgi:hypothetical protein